jgi:uncharacterized protein (TIRG00374 family)
VTSHDQDPDPAGPPGESQPASARRNAHARPKSKDTATGEQSAARNSPDAGHATRQPARSWPLSRKTIVTRSVALAISGLAIYLLLPSLTRALASWPRLLRLDWVWLTVALIAELASFTCTYALQRLALQTREWFSVVTAGLAGNSISGILPGGAAVGAGLQFEMLSNAGFDTGAAAAALTAFSLLEVGALLALPIVALPAVLAGSAVSPGLVHTALLGLGMFCLLAIVGGVLLKTDRPLAAAGRAAQAVRNRITRGRRPPLTGLDARLLSERDTIKSVLGHNWWQALLLTAGRLGFDFGCLLAVLRATGTHPRHALVLLAYAAANVIELVPITPGGLGLVEGSLTGLLVLAGVHGGDALLATLAYRLASYWLPLCAGPFAYLLYRHRYGRWSHQSRH